MDESYDIKWKNHTTEAFEVVNRLHRLEALADVVLFCGDEQFRAHKVILAACSAYFERVFLNIPADLSNKSAVILRDTNAEIFKRALSFMYEGQVQVPTDQLTEFMLVADSLEIRGLKKGGQQQNAKPAAKAAAPKSRKPIADKAVVAHNSVKQENVIDNPLALPGELFSTDDQPPAPKKPKLNEHRAHIMTSNTKKRFSLPSGVSVEPAVRFVNSKNRSAAADNSVPKPIAAHPAPFQVSSFINSRLASNAIIRFLKFFAHSNG
jgi:hypothetical protein